MQAAVQAITGPLLDWEAAVVQRQLDTTYRGRIGAGGHLLKAWWAAIAEDWLPHRHPYFPTFSPHRSSAKQHGSRGPSGTIALVALRSCSVTGGVLKAPGSIHVCIWWPIQGSVEAEAGVAQQREAPPPASCYLYIRSQPHPSCCISHHLSDTPTCTSLLRWSHIHFAIRFATAQ